VSFEELTLKIYVLGAGALGCAMGGVLTEAGHEVWLINRNVAQVEAMTQRGLVLRTDGMDRTVRVRAATSAAGVDPVSGPADLLIVLVKSFHTEEAMRSAVSLLGPQTVVLSLQNGLGHEDVLANIVGRDKLLAGKTYVGGSQLAPGHVIAGTRRKLTLIGELDGGVSARADAVAAVFNAAGLDTTVSDNIIGAIWDKLLVNVATGALSGITRLPYGELYQVPEVEACAVAAVTEAMAVARACGLRLSIAEPVDAWRMAGAGLPFEFKTSMLQSLEKGSVTEIDYINGAVVQQGARYGISTPVNQTLVAAIKGIEKSLKTSQSTQTPTNLT
jgi:2-dehydropantoate 2-reductase